MEEGFTKREKLVGFFLLFIVILTMVTLLVIVQGKGWFLSYRRALQLMSGTDWQIWFATAHAFIASPSFER